MSSRQNGTKTSIQNLNGDDREVGGHQTARPQPSRESKSYALFIGCQDTQTPARRVIGRGMEDWQVQRRRMQNPIKRDCPWVILKMENMPNRSPQLCRNGFGINTLGPKQGNEPSGTPKGLVSQSAFGWPTTAGLAFSMARVNEQNLSPNKQMLSLDEKIPFTGYQNHSTSRCGQSLLVSYSA